MSKTDKTKPARIQIAEAIEKRGGWEHINWHTDVTYSRYEGDKCYLAEKRRRKYPDWRKNGY